MPAKMNFKMKITYVLFQIDITEYSLLAGPILQEIIQKNVQATGEISPN
jgi:hypothetical protein